MYCNKKEKVANHCLVICIGIAKYSKETAIPDCDNVAQDIKTYTKTFQQSPNYTVISNNCNEMYTKGRLTSYLSHCFYHHLYDSSMDCIKYNALIMTISGHCTENSIICSNGDCVHFTEILSIFTSSWKHRKLILNLPKFLIIDGQRGFNYLSLPNINIINDDKKQDIAYIEAQTMDQNIMDTYSAILCSVSRCLDSTIYGGTLCCNLSSILTQNMKLKNDIIFYDIIKELKKRLNVAVDNGGLSLYFTEHDIDIDDVVFTAKSMASSDIKYKRSISMSSVTVLNPIHKNDRKNKKSLSANPLSPRRLNILQRRSTFTNNKKSIVHDDEDKYINKDPMFKGVMEWNKSIETMSKTKDKTRVRVQWLFVIDNESHNVCLLHSQKHNPLNKAKRVLFIDGTQIWNKKSKETQFTEMYKGNVFIVSIVYNHEKKYKYDLKINNKTHKQLFQRWHKDLLNKTFID